MTLSKSRKQNLPKQKPRAPTVLCNYLESLGVLYEAPKRYAQLIHFDIQLLENELEQRLQSKTISAEVTTDLFLHAPAFEQ